MSDSDLQYRDAEQQRSEDGMEHPTHNVIRSLAIIFLGYVVVAGLVLWWHW